MSRLAEGQVTPGSTLATPAAQLLTVDQVAATLCISKQRAYELTRNGILPVVKIGRQVRVDPIRLQDWISAGGTGLAEASESGY